MLMGVLRYHVAFYLPRGDQKIVVAEALDFPGALSQGFDLADARLIIAGALQGLAQALLEEGKPLPRPNPDASTARGRGIRSASTLSGASKLRYRGTRRSTIDWRRRSAGKSGSRGSVNGRHPARSRGFFST